MPSRDYLYTFSYPKGEGFAPLPGSIYFYGYSYEARSHWADTLVQKFYDKTKFIGISEVAKDIIRDISTNQQYSLRNKKEMSQFLNTYSAGTIYIDITGLNSRICASMLRNTVDNQYRDIRIIYAEPEAYKVKQFSSEGVFHDLSETISGIEPLPGFATIVPDDNKEIYFIPLLGFEGGRFTHMFENIHPPGDNIIPIIGVPGFRPEYPFVAYWGNRQPLKDTESWRNIRYISANSIVEAFYVLKKVHKTYPNCKLKIAPIGTKPHAIGAILYAIKFPDAELIYDNPKRSKQRTDGIGKIIECNICKLLEEKF